ncbi:MULTISPECIES: hypothetical protein [Nostoc]|uniref:Uncharacterized protein n=1 Tax=Nostoc paludosum FACHB-159 TaxID=2692908 RepID=A0ABR8KD32_9NOSO|nr:MULTISPECIES: hypothetical protein [Nostoc]MBD2681004.1 hypothetical protein [Nostoc sp. FACHB-857]MBD2737451.1 hypothetical protein [Nostoc paludosum FACHB-159]
MNTKNQLTFWTDSKHQRYFLIPENHKLSRGRFIISTLTGTQKKVTQVAIANFEIPESAAKAYLENEIHQAMAQAKIAVSNLMLSSTETSEKSPPESKQTPSVSNILSSLLGDKIEDLQNNPEAAKIAFVNIYTQFQDFLSESISENCTQVESTRSHLHHLRETLQAEELEELPKKLQEVFSSANMEEYLQEIVIKLRDLTEEIEQSPGGFEQIIDETIKSLSQDSFSDEDKELEEKKKEDYKQSAENAIAQSLKSRGFTTFGGGNFNQIR